MRILLDESVPARLAALLTGHQVASVRQRGWTSTKNGQLLMLEADEFDVLITADRGFEYQQNPATLPIAVLIVIAKSNRMEHMAPAVPSILDALPRLTAKALHKIVA
jgi:predicted nuclease of predicted toxin-antitoxin system